MTHMNGSQRIPSNGAVSAGLPSKKAEAVVPTIPLHRLRAARRQEKISQRTVARHLGITVAEVKVQEMEGADLPLSVLYRWREVLNVPLVELLAEPEGSLSPPLMRRAQMVRLMKTALAIHDDSRQISVQRFAQTLIEQLTEMMPELEGIGPWHRVGKRRRRDEYGRAAELSMPDDLFLRDMES